MASNKRRRPLGVPIAVMAGVLAATLLAHRLLPETLGLALAVEAVLPWLGAPVLLLLVAALARRARLGVWVSLAAVLAWAMVFVPQILPLEAQAGAAEGAAESAADSSLSVLSQNVRGADRDAVSTATAAAAREPDLLALQEVDGGSRPGVAAALAERYPYTVTVGTVGLWSRFPILDTEPLDLGLGWSRALRAVVAAPGGDVTVYVVHAASARPLAHDDRDTMLAELARVIAGDDSARLIAVGDFNAGSEDRAFRALRATLSEPRQTGGGFGFTWPAAFPAVRLDHVLVRGFAASDMAAVPLGDSDHLAVTAELRASA